MTSEPISLYLSPPKSDSKPIKEYIFDLKLIRDRENLHWYRVLAYGEVYNCLFLINHVGKCYSTDTTLDAINIFESSKPCYVYVQDEEEKKFMDDYLEDLEKLCSFLIQVEESFCIEDDIKDNKLFYEKLGDGVTLSQSVLDILTYQFKGFLSNTGYSITTPIRNHNYRVTRSGENWFRADNGKEVMIDFYRKVHKDACEGKGTNSCLISVTGTKIHFHYHFLTLSSDYFEKCSNFYKGETKEVETKYSAFALTALHYFIYLREIPLESFPIEHIMENFTELYSVSLQYCLHKMRQDLIEIFCLNYWRLEDPVKTLKEIITLNSGAVKLKAHNMLEKLYEQIKPPN